MILVTKLYESPVGELKLVVSDTGVRAILFPNDLVESGRTRVKLADNEPGDHPIIDRLASQLDDYFAGSLTQFDLPLDPVGTELQVEVWHSLANIAYGETTSYGNQAKRLGRPTAVRAVANANGKNPIPIVLPCHRVIGSDGSLTGFASGLGTKRWLLTHEGFLEPTLNV